MLVSIRAFVTVKAPVTKQTCASPVCITTAAISACLSGLTASSIRSRYIWSQTSLVIEKLEFSSTVNVWWAPIRTISFSLVTWPDILSCKTSGSKSTLLTWMVNMTRFFWLVVDPVDDSLTTFRTVVHRTSSPSCTKLYACHKSSAISGIKKIMPPPSFWLICFFNSFMFTVRREGVFGWKKWSMMGRQSVGGAILHPQDPEG